MVDRIAQQPGARERVIHAAARLLQEQGVAAVTTRGVADAAGVQAPAIYRLFGDKDGLLEAVAEHVLATHVAAKSEAADTASAADTDPVEELAESWRAQLEFGLANPALFRLLHDPDRARRSAAARSGLEVLRSRVRRVAAAGRLRVSEQRAVDLIHATGTGVIQTQLAAAADDRDPDLGEAAWRAVAAQILTDAAAAPAQGTTSAAVALRARAPHLAALTEAERQLLAEWLDRVIRSS